MLALGRFEFHVLLMFLSFLRTGTQRSLGATKAHPSRAASRRILEASKTMRSMSTLRKRDVVVLSRLMSANHDLITPPPPPPNPIVRFGAWWASWAVPGMGIFLGSYVLFGVGNIQPLLADRYPNW
jgi:hypothetical protein